MRKRLKKKMAKRQWDGVYTYEIEDGDVIINTKVFDNMSFTADDFKEAMEKIEAGRYPKVQGFFPMSFIPYHILDSGPLRCICEECNKKRADYIDWRESDTKTP
jgi:hypothetical protein